MNWNDMRHPKKDPMREVRDPNMGMALATIYAVRQMPRVQPSQVIQCVAVFAVRCLEPRKKRTRIYFPGICT